MRWRLGEVELKGSWQVERIREYCDDLDTWRESMDEYRMARRVSMAEVSGGWVLGRPRLGWIHGVKVALGNRGMTMKAARQCGERQERVESHGAYVTE